MERRMPCEDGDRDLGLYGCKATDKFCKALSVDRSERINQPGYTELF